MKSDLSALRFPLSAFLLLGPTGAGKTPLGECLEQRGLGGRRCVHFDFGANLRRAAELGGGHGLTDEDLRVVRHSLATGALLEDHQFAIVGKILSGFVEEKGFVAHDCLVLNGMPRHAGQARSMEAWVRVQGVISLECELGVVAQRIRENRGGDRVGRADDGEAAVERKLALFRERTAPLLDHYRGKGVKVWSIAVGAGTRPEEIVTELERLGRMT